MKNKDNRKLKWSDIEDDIQSRINNKDVNLFINMPKKIYKGIYKDYKLFVVDGEWIRNNLSIIFGNGGHGCVHEFIPLDEIWVSLYHPDGTKSTNNYIISCIEHEIHECDLMKSGVNYWNAHNSALDYERKLNLISEEEINY